jgi:aryl-alcohol dehydrogenase-like predicted oxidoreductase
MKYRRLGNSGLLVSELALGTWLTFHNQLAAEECKDVVSKALELGINTFDTADVYAGGEAERLLGAALRSLARRDEFVVSSKVFFPMGEAATSRGLSRKHIYDALTSSLERLGLSYIDIYICHDYDPRVPLVETLRAMQDLIAAGKIMYYGLCNWTAEQLTDALSVCRARGWIPPSVVQMRYSLAERSAETSVLPVCSRHGVGVAIGSPLSGGLLSGKYLHEMPAGSRGSQNRLNMFMRDLLEDRVLSGRIEAFRELARREGKPPAVLALAYALQKTGVSTVITGASSPEQLSRNAAASGLRLSPKLVDDIELVFTDEY